MKHPRGQAGNAGQFRRRQVPQPPPAGRRKSRPGTPAGAAEEWQPPGYTPGFTDYYKGLIPDDATAEELDELADSYDHLMQAAVAIHTNTDGATLIYLAANEPLRDVKAALLANPDLPSEALTEIYEMTGRAPYTPADARIRAICEAHPNWAGVNV
ncbi:MAG: hypothetical protein F4Z31_02400 [Gemmatimonadetes bacterium]|nr:hypothetical protein [Gemmatimonadota bacterium]